MFPNSYLCSSLLSSPKHEQYTKPLTEICKRLSYIIDIHLEISAVVDNVTKMNGGQANCHGLVKRKALPFKNSAPELELNVDVFTGH